MPPGGTTLDTFPEGWPRVPRRIRALIIAAGVYPEDVDRLKDEELLKVPGLTEKDLQLLREHIPWETPHEIVSSDPDVARPARPLPPRKRPTRAKQLRGTFMELLDLTLSETIRRIGMVEEGLPDLDAMDADELRKWIREQPGIVLQNSDLKGLLDVCGKYGIGQRHVHAGDGDEPIAILVAAAQVPDPSLDPKKEIPREPRG